MIILDSNIWISLLYDKDVNHNQAKELVGGLKIKIIVTEYIILETVTILTKKKSKKTADKFLEKISISDKVEILLSSKEFLDEVVGFYLKQDDRDLSFVDYSLLFLSQQLEVVTFDRKLQNAIRNLN